MSFEGQIQQWVSIDNQLKQLNEKSKELREKRNVLEQNITTYANNNKLIMEHIKQKRNIKVVPEIKRFSNN